MKQRRMPRRYHIPVYCPPWRTYVSQFNPKLGTGTTYVYEDDVLIDVQHYANAEGVARSVLGRRLIANQRRRRT